MGKLRALILQLKFRHRERLGMRLGGLLSRHWDWAEEAGAGGPPPLLVPVPLHPSRERERGFNQAELLARGLSRKLAETGRDSPTSVEVSCLLRTRATPPQTGLSAAARRANVRGVFSVVFPERVRGRLVVVVDDVMTTGATLSACSQALRAAGAGVVLGLTLARATPEFPDVTSGPASLAVDDLGPE
jgi:ComF family protein